MMRVTLNEKGIALVMVLILSMICLAMVASLLFMISQGSQISGFQKFYRTVEEASLGGASVTAAFIQYRGAASADMTANLSNALYGNAAGSSAGCTAQKILLARASWTACTSANDVSWDPTSNPDMRFDLVGLTQTYRVFGKIIDTIEGNSENSTLVTGGGQLGGAGVVASNSAMISPPHIPYLYSIEIQAQNSATARERSSLSVLYAY
jgi:hypothetical protein